MGSFQAWHCLCQWHGRPGHRSAGTKSRCQPETDYPCFSRRIIVLGGLSWLSTSSELQEGLPHKRSSFWPTKKNSSESARTLRETITPKKQGLGRVTLIQRTAARFRLYCSLGQQYSGVDSSEKAEAQETKQRKDPTFRCQT